MALPIQPMTMYQNSGKLYFKIFKKGIGFTGSESSAWKQMRNIWNYCSLVSSSSSKWTAFLHHITSILIRNKLQFMKWKAKWCTYEDCLWVHRNTGAGGWFKFKSAFGWNINKTSSLFALYVVLRTPLFCIDSYNIRPLLSHKFASDITCD